MVEKTSPAFSFKGWDIWEFAKGRKKTAITLLAVILGYFITSDELIAIVAGGVVEMAWAVIEFYATKVKI
jgi:hypothetical protein